MESTLFPMIANAAIWFSKEYVLLAVMLYGYSKSPHRESYTLAIIGLLFTTFFNGFLKSIWQVPLPTHLDQNWWSFPSGHMQAGCVFWLILAISIPYWRLRVFVAGLLPLLGWGLIYKGFHHLPDVLAAFGFAVLTAYLLVYSKRNIKVLQLERLALVLLIVGCSLAHIVALWKPHLGIAMGGLLGIATGRMLIKPYCYDPAARSIIQNLFLVLGSAGLFMGLYPMLSATGVNLLWVNFVTMFAVAFWLEFLADWLYLRLFFKLIACRV